MSENFDKEAERKRLREKYESDSGDREVTERMSQLLLQGATMTNKHCETCGSPIFRYQGQAFCPTCQAEAEAADAASQPAASDTAGAESTAQSSAGAEVNADGQPATGDGSGSDSADATGAQPADASGTHPAGAEAGGSSDADEAGHESVGTASTGTAELGAKTGAEPAPSGAESPAPDATRSLAETIVTLSDRARETEDPTRAKALLEAAREAAETLARVQGR